MKLRILWLGKTKNAKLAAVFEELLTRSNHFVGTEITELKEPRVKEEKKRVQLEGERLLSVIDHSTFVVALDPLGRAYTSKEFSAFLEKHMTEDPRDLVFVVGGHAGLSESVKKRANLLWSLSSLTYSHDLARAVLLEQIYRALTIIRNIPYAR
jgi:23S rRNA (pseudouridine1915-N3)-methyltransferase